MNENKQPTLIPPVIAETGIEKRRYAEADDRRNRRILEARERKVKRANWMASLAYKFSIKLDKNG